MRTNCVIIPLKRESEPTRHLFDFPLLIKCESCVKEVTPEDIHKDSEICVECYLREVEFRNDYQKEYDNIYNLKF